MRSNQRHIFQGGFNRYQRYYYRWNESRNVQGTTRFWRRPRFQETHGVRQFRHIANISPVVRSLCVGLPGVNQPTAAAIRREILWTARKTSIAPAITGIGSSGIGTYFNNLGWMRMSARSTQIYKRRGAITSEEFTILIARISHSRIDSSPGSR